MKLITSNLALAAVFSPFISRNSTFSKLGATVVFLFMGLFSATDATAQAMCSPPAQGVPAVVSSCGNPEFTSCSIDVLGILAGR